MAIYGVALLSACMFIGVWIGSTLGYALGLPSDVGGVGFAMVVLMLASEYADKKGWMTDAANSGIKFWSAMYIPIVVAMAMNQNVVAAIKGGPCAILAGIGAVVVMFALVRPLAAMVKPSEDWEG
ncbi:malonate transporter subunit MadL [Microvirga sp. W0021]|uniref:Malonate transporter subunit MadL n=1 Tax=Hohaiivirga grylli TaxID=3133970 RepID=A0ABV0BKY1_9HYPH